MNKMPHTNRTAKTPPLSQPTTAVSDDVEYIYYFSNTVVGERKSPCVRVYVAIWQQYLLLIKYERIKHESSLVVRHNETMYFRNLTSFGETKEMKLVEPNKLEQISTPGTGRTKETSNARIHILTSTWPLKTSHEISRLRHVGLMTIM